jgi:hypothetical protein
MREINTENNNHVFKVGIKEKGELFVNGFELTARCAEAEGVMQGADPKVKDIVEAMKEVAWCDDEGFVDSLSDNELFSAGMTVLVEIESLGND